MMRGRRLIVAVLVAVAGAAPLGAACAPAQRASAVVPPRIGCPKNLTGYTARPLTLAEALGAARRIVARGIESNQGRRERRTPENQEVLEVILVTPFSPDGKGLAKLAHRYCGDRIAAATLWAVTFHDTLSVLCCVTQTVFVAATREHVYVFGEL